MRDLFQEDDGGWLQDPVLLDRLVAEKLEREAEAIRAEGWKWIEVAPDFPYGHTYGLRHISGEPVAMTEEEAATPTPCRRSMTGSSKPMRMPTSCPKRSISGLARSRRRLPPSTIGRSRSIPRRSRALARSSASMARGLRVERGYVRPEDEPPFRIRAGDETRGHGRCRGGRGRSTWSRDGQQPRGPGGSRRKTRA